MQNDKEKNKGESDFKGLSFAYRISTELAAALIVSVLIGPVSYTHLTLPTKA